MLIAERRDIVGIVSDNCMDCMAKLSGYHFLLDDN
jgi:hypothetical protein